MDPRCVVCDKKHPLSTLDKSVIGNMNAICAGKFNRMTRMRQAAATELALHRARGKS